MAYKVIILYQLYMPSYFLGTFTEYPFLDSPWFHQNTFDLFFPRSISDYRAGYPTAIPTADYIL